MIILEGMAPLILAERTKRMKKGKDEGGRQRLADLKIEIGDDLEGDWGIKGEQQCTGGK